MSAAFTSSDIMTGADVFGADGEKVGTVAAVYPAYIVVEKGFFFPTDYYVPMSAVANYDNGDVYLNLARDAALQSGWDAQPVDLDTAVYDTAATSTTGLGATTTDIAGNEEIRIPVMEEELTAVVRPQEAGAVRIEKDVVTEERSLDVPITEERVRIERRVVDRPLSAVDVGAFEDTVIEVPVRTETVEVHKQARVAEEVVLSKEAVQRTEHVTGAVRREEVLIDEDATVIEGDNTRSNPTI